MKFGTFSDFKKGWNNTWNSVSKGIGNIWNNVTGATAKMKWEKQMSDTAHQREMADLQESGINPILTADGGNGASTPSSPSSSSSIIGEASSTINSLLSSASSIIRETNRKDFNERTLSHKERSLAERSRDKAVTNQLYDKSGKLISTAESLIRKL